MAASLPGVEWDGYTRRQDDRSPRRAGGTATCPRGALSTRPTSERDIRADRSARRRLGALGSPAGARRRAGARRWCASRCSSTARCWAPRCLGAAGRALAALGQLRRRAARGLAAGRRRRRAAGGGRRHPALARSRSARASASARAAPCAPRWARSARRVLAARARQRRRRGGVLPRRAPAAGRAAGGEPALRRGALRPAPRAAALDRLRVRARACCSAGSSRRPGNLVAPVVAHAGVNGVNLRLLTRQASEPASAGARSRRSRSARRAAARPPAPSRARAAGARSK